MPCHDTQTPSPAGSSSPTTVGPSDIFTREDLTDEQRMFGQTAAEFMRKEVLPDEQRALRARLGR